MLRLDLARLAREGSVLVEGNIPAEDELWEGSGVALSGPVRFALRARYAGSGELIVRGSVEAPLRAECRRCLEPVDTRLEEDVTLVFVSSDVEGADEDGDGWSYDAGAGELDLGEAVREEVILAVDPYVVCRPECKGLCARCGVDLNTGTCDCREGEPDPRWEALRALKER